MEVGVLLDGLMEALEWVVQVRLLYHSVNDRIEAHVHAIVDRLRVVLHLIVVNAMLLVCAVETFNYSM